MGLDDGSGARAPDRPGAWTASVHPAARSDAARRWERLTADIVEPARRHGCLGYWKIAEMLRSTAGWIVNDKRVERIWQRCHIKRFYWYSAARTG